jgi:hypothetical protein
MKDRKVASNQTERDCEGGTIILFSYRTPVAAFVPGEGALCTTTSYSRTTWRHITLAVKRWDAERKDVEQKIIDRLVKLKGEP